MSPMARDSLVWWGGVAVLNGVASWLMEIPFWLLPVAFLGLVALSWAAEKVFRR